MNAYCALLVLGIRYRLLEREYIIRGSLYATFQLQLISFIWCTSNIVRSSFSDQLPVSTKFDMRSDLGVVRNYGRLLLEMVSVVPDGIVCFFVSYSYMDEIVNSWNESGILKVSILVNLFLLAPVSLIVISYPFLICLAGNYAT